MIGIHCVVPIIETFIIEMNSENIKDSVLKREAARVLGSMMYLGKRIRQSICQIADNVWYAVRLRGRKTSYLIYRRFPCGYGKTGELPWVGREQNNAQTM